MLEKLEKQFIGKMSLIKRGQIKPDDSEIIGKLLFKIKKLDEPLFLKLVDRYQKEIKKLN